MRPESKPTLRLMSVISGFHLDVNENCALLGYYAASSGNSLPTFQDSLTLEDGTDRLSRIFGKELSYSLHKSPEERSS